MIDPFIFDQPKFNEDGSCSVIKELGQPYDLRRWYVASDRAKIHNDLLSLYRICQRVQSETSVDWFGIYLLMKEDLLVKHAYIGDFSKAEFKVNADVAKISNNSHVAFYGSSVIINDIRNYEGPYYQCDAKVLSECCMPLLDSDNRIFGIIDAEDFEINFFDDKHDYFKKICSEIIEFLYQSRIYPYINPRRKTSL